MNDIVLFKGEILDGLGHSEVIQSDTEKDVRSNKSGLVIILGGDNSINRKAVESKKVDILLSPETGRVHDFIHHRNSGLNQILCKLAHKNKVAIGFSFSDILNSKNRSELIGRMMQNIRLCRKYQVKMVFASFAKNKNEMRNVNDLKSLARILGMSPLEVKESFEFVKKKFDKVEEVID